jgi:galactose mutarotase-like enzyme
VPIVRRHPDSPKRSNFERTAKDGECTTYVAAHQHDKDAPPNIGVHALFPCKFHESRAANVLCIDLVLLCGGSVLLVDERVASPRGTDKPPFTLCFRSTEVTQ